MKKNRTAPKTAHWIIFGLMLLVMCCPANVFSQETPRFQITDNWGTPQTDFSQSDIVRYNLFFDFEFPTFILSVLSISYQGASSDNPAYKVNLFVPGISPEIRASRSADIDTGPIFDFFSHHIFWRVAVPQTAWGTAEATVTLITVPGSIYILTREFSISDSLGDDNDTGSTRVCGACHQDIYKGWRTSNHYPAVKCVACHGSGEDHVRNPSAANIKSPGSADFCHVCHSRNSGSGITAADGFITPMQQNNEVSATRHSRFNCLTCHDPHYGPSSGSNYGIKKTCVTCHDQKVYLNMQELLCIDCHMPYAVKNDTWSGGGNYRKGDVRSHLVRIRASDDPDRMFNTGGTALALDDTGKPFMNLSFACLSCHNGIDAVLQDYRSMQLTHMLIH